MIATRNPSRLVNGALRVLESDHPVEALFRKLKTVRPYPTGVVPVLKRKQDTAFFPGGSGLWGTQPGKPLPTMPVGKVMVLGHDFGNEDGHEASFAAPGENLKSPTWRNLLGLLEAVDVSPHDCFFTNAYMGLRAGNAQATGRFPGARCAGFVRRCQTFLACQIATQKPRLILALGVHVPAVIAPLSNDLAGWEKCRNFRGLDQRNQALLPNVDFGDDIGVQSTIVALTHSCMWHRNVVNRRYKRRQGKRAELQLLQDAIAISGLRRGNKRRLIPKGV